MVSVGCRGLVQAPALIGPGGALQTGDELHDNQASNRRDGASHEGQQTHTRCKGLFGVHLNVQLGNLTTHERVAALGEG